MKIRKSALCFCVMFMLMAVAGNARSSFYQARTMAGYCKEYIRMISLESPYNQLEAGICSGYLASKIEVMDLSGQLCEREKVNLDDVVRAFIEHVEANGDSKEHTATYSAVELLDKKYACVKQS